MAYSVGDTLVRAIMTAYSGLPQDVVVNDFAFKFSGTPSAADYANVMDAVSGFYRDVQASGLSVGEHISNWVDRAATHELAAYQITTPPMGSPVATTPWLGPPTAQAASGMVTEAAAVLSFHADLTGVLEEFGTTHPRARRRGRVYIGPLVGGSGTLVTTTPPYLLASNLTLTMRQAAVAMQAAALADGWTWSVWSRKDTLLRAVVGGWTDNAPDTQRRRGPAPTARVTYSI